MHPYCVYIKDGRLSHFPCVSVCGNELHVFITVLLCFNRASHPSAARTLLFRLISNKTERCTVPAHRSFAVPLFIRYIEKIPEKSQFWGKMFS
jgi:hypothetical protein